MEAMMEQQGDGDGGSGGVPALGGEGGGGGSGGGCRHRAHCHPEDVINNLFVRCLELMEISPEQIEGEGSSGEVHMPSEVDQYILPLLDEVAQLTTLQLQRSLSSVENIEWHVIISIEELCHPHYLLDVKHETTQCYNSNVCPTVRQGDVILLDTRDNCLDIKKLSFAVASEDEDEAFHSAFKVQIVGKSKLTVASMNYTYATCLRTNIQHRVQSWLSGHAVIENKNQCIMNSIMQSGDLVAGSCPYPEHCPDLFDGSGTQFFDGLDGHQQKAMKSIALSLSCSHTKHKIEVINGPPSSGKTKLLSHLVLSFVHQLKCVVFGSSPAITSLLSEIYHGMPRDKFMQFCETAIFLGSKSDIGADFSHMTFESHMDAVVKYLGHPGWKYFINYAVKVLKEYKPMYEVLIERGQRMTFLDFFKHEFVIASSQVKDCIRFLQTKNCDMGIGITITRTLEEFEKKLCHPQLENSAVKEIFNVVPVKGSHITNASYSIAEELNQMRCNCIDMLGNLKIILHPPAFKRREEAKGYCLTTSTVLFCSTDSSFSLSDINQHIDCLIVDDAHLLNESNTLAPLCLPSLRSIILAGYLPQEHPLKSQESEFGPSLFERLLHFGFREHLMVGQHTPERRVSEGLSQLKSLQVEFTWIGRPHNTKQILAPVRHQGSKDTCTLHATMATTESLYKYLYASENPPRDFVMILDMADMLMQYKEEYGCEFGEEPKGKRGWARALVALRCLNKHGVKATDEFTSDGKVVKSTRIRISSFKEIAVSDVNQVCEHLRNGHILVGSIRMSLNFFELSPGEVYHYDPKRPMLTAKSSWSHAVMMVGYGGPGWEVLKDDTDSADMQICESEQMANVCHLAFQNSYGTIYGFRGGYGRVGLESVTHLCVVTL